jgi:nitrite reductase/ring-hydroxylating ferredoxin subunit
MTETDTPRTTSLDRRTMLCGAAVGGAALPLLAACGGETTTGGEGSGGGSAIVAASDVPVGGGTILKDEEVVVTQPKKGDYKAFTAVCTHQGCTVTKVEGGQIVCPCHGSHFSIEDGSPTSGPAQKALASKTVSVEGGQVSVD